MSSNFWPPLLPLTLFHLWDSFCVQALILIIQIKFPLTVFYDFQNQIDFLFHFQPFYAIFQEFASPKNLFSTLNNKIFHKKRASLPHLINCIARSAKLIDESRPKKHKNSFFSFADNKYPHHQTGHYRNKSSKIWDPHPQYQIDAADEHHFVIHLQQEPDLVAPKFEVMNHFVTALGGYNWRDASSRAFKCAEWHLKHEKI